MTAVRRAILLIGALFTVVGHSEEIEIKVSVQDPSLNRDSKTDTSANVPELGISGYLVYPKPRFGNDSCREFLHQNYSSYVNYIALIDDYDNCTYQHELQLALLNAGYVGMIGVSENLWGFRSITGDFAIALVKNGDFGNYLKHYAGINFTKVTLEEDMSAYQHYFLIFSALLLSAIVLSVLVFCCTMCCRLGVHRWANRRVTLWSVRRLPKRKYCAERDTCDTCSICLEPFKENESLRVLPCQHVYHPRCIDEWLHKWNCVCPLCKANITVGGRNQGRQGAVGEERVTERVRLLVNEGPTVESGGSYGTAGVQAPPPPATAAVVTTTTECASPQTQGAVPSLADEGSCVPLVAEQVEQSPHDTAVKA